MEVHVFLSQLMDKVAQLEAQLNQHSGNSSKALFSNLPKSPCTPHSRQPGHPGRHRPLLPSDQVDAMVILSQRSVPTVSMICPMAPPMQRHQITDAPPIQPHVTEQHLRAMYCPHCQQPVRATLPVPTGAFGPRVTALIATDSAMPDI